MYLGTNEEILYQVNKYGKDKCVVMNEQDLITFANFVYERFFDKSFGEELEDCNRLKTVEEAIDCLEGAYYDEDCYEVTVC